jgi:hypothetical protein
MIGRDKGRAQELSPASFSSTGGEPCPEGFLGRALTRARRGWNMLGLDALRRGPRRQTRPLTSEIRSDVGDVRDVVTELMERLLQSVLADRAGRRAGGTAISMEGCPF